MKILASLLYFLIALSLYGQEKSPVSWSATLISTATNTYEVEVVATIQQGWFIYAVDTPEGGPIPTEVSLDQSRDLEWVTEMAQVTEAKEGFDELFEINVKKMAETAVFRQTIKTLSTYPSVSGTAYFMTCDGSQCLAPTTHTFVATKN